VIVAYFDDEPGGQRLAFSGPARAPTAGPARRTSREARRLDERLELLERAPTLRRRKAGGEADVVEEALRVVEPQQKRADDA